MPQDRPRLLSIDIPQLPQPSHGGRPAADVREPLDIPRGMAMDPSIAQAVRLGEIDPKVWLPLVLGTAGGLMTGGASIPVQMGIDAAISGGTSAAMGGSTEENFENAATSAATLGGGALAFKGAEKLALKLMGPSKKAIAEATAAADHARRVTQAERAQAQVDRVNRAMKPKTITTDVYAENPGKNGVPDWVFDPSIGQLRRPTNEITYEVESEVARAMQEQAERNRLMHGVTGADVQPSPPFGLPRDMPDVTPPATVPGGIPWGKYAALGAGAGATTLGIQAVRDAWARMFGK